MIWMEILLLLMTLIFSILDERIEQNVKGK